MFGVVVFSFHRKFNFGLVLSVTIIQTVFMKIQSSNATNDNPEDDYNCF